MATFSYRRAYRRFHFLPPYLILSIAVSLVHALSANHEMIFAINWSAELGLAVLAAACLLEQCYFQLRYSPFRLALWCLVSGVLCWWGEHNTRYVSTIFGLPRRAFWVVLLLRSLTIGLFVLFVSLAFRKRLPIRRPLYVSGMFFGLGLVTCYLFVGSLAGLVFKQNLEPVAPLVSCQIRLIGAGFLLFVFSKKEPPWKPSSLELINRMSKYIASSADQLTREVDALARDSPELAGLLSSRTSAELEILRNGSNGRAPRSRVDHESDNEG